MTKNAKNEIKEVFSAWSAFVDAYSRASKKAAEIGCPLPGITKKRDCHDQQAVVWLAVHMIEDEPLPNGATWKMDVIGVFSDEEKAIAACKSTRDCIMPLRMDDVAPEEVTIHPDAYYPLDPLSAKRIELRRRLHCDTLPVADSEKEGDKEVLNSDKPSA